MTTKQIGFGIVGCGTIADFHYIGIEASEQAKLVAVCDVNLDRAKAFAADHGDPAVFSSVEDMVQMEGVEAVSICTPSGYHLDSILPALARGKHILVEKPLEITTKKVDEIIAQAAANNAKIGGIFQLRLSPDVLKVKEGLEAGHFGKILIADAYIKYYRDQVYYDSAGWRGTWGVDGGGALMNQGIHYIDLLLWLVGDVAEITGAHYTLDRKIEVEDTAHALIKYGNGAIGTITATTCAYPGFPSRLEIHGDKGSVCLEDDKIASWNIIGEETTVEGTESDEKGHSDPKAISTRGHILQIQDFVEAILEEREPAVNAIECRRSVAAIEAIYQSSKSGKPVTL